MDELLDWAADRPLFTVNDALRASGMERASLREKLSRMARRSDLIRVERGKYTVHDDPLIYATYLERPSYVSFWSGLRFYDFTTQQPTRVQVATAVNREDLDEIEFFIVSPLFGFGKRRHAGFDILVADEERLLIDCLSRNLVPVTELTELLEAADVDRVTAYAERFDRASVKKRLGYLLERERGVTVDALRVADRNYPVLDLTRAESGETNSDWRLRVNADA